MREQRDETRSPAVFVHLACGVRGVAVDGLDVIRDGLVDVVINTSENRITGTLRDGFHIRRAAAEKRIPCFTSLDTARAAAAALTEGGLRYDVRPLTEYLAEPAS